MIIIHAESNGLKEERGSTRIEGRHFSQAELMNLFANVVNAVYKSCQETMKAPDEVVDFLIRRAFDASLEARKIKNEGTDV